MGAPVAPKVRTGFSTVLSEATGTNGRTPAGGGPMNLLKVGMQVIWLTRFCSTSPVARRASGGCLPPQPIAAATSSAAVDLKLHVLVSMTTPHFLPTSADLGPAECRARPHSPIESRLARERRNPARHAAS